MIRGQGAQRATSNWRKRFSIMNSKVDNPRKALGRGLGALIPTRPTTPPLNGQADEPPAVPADSIDPNPFQPRRFFHAERLEELAQSIRANGIIQPLVVRKAGERYQLVAGGSGPGGA